MKEARQTSTDLTGALTMSDPLALLSDGYSKTCFVSGNHARLVC
jgi:hypothetical protein